MRYFWTLCADLHNLVYASAPHVKAATPAEAFDLIAKELVKKTGDTRTWDIALWEDSPENYHPSGCPIYVHTATITYNASTGEHASDIGDATEVPREIMTTPAAQEPQVSAKELLRRGLECGMFDGAPHFIMDVRRCLGLKTEPGKGRYENKHDGITIIVDGGLVQEVFGPAHLFPKGTTVAIVDLNTEGADDEDIVKYDVIGQSGSLVEDKAYISEQTLAISASSPVLTWSDCPASYFDDK